MKRTAAFILAFLAITLLALFLRAWRLDVRPMHHDEANQAVRTWNLVETGVYRYDPDEHHGPTLYYLAAPFIRIYSGKSFANADEIGFRLIPALFGVALIPMLLILRNAFSRTPLLVAALLTAVSPAMVFYSRYFIQEMLLVFFTFGVVACGWRYFLKPSFGWALGAGLFAGLMFATKETSVLAYVAMAVGVGAVALGEVRRGDAGASGWTRIKSVHVLLGLGAALLTAALLFSSFASHPSGIPDSVRSFGDYLDRGFTGSLHLHPWWYYFRILLYTNQGRGPVWTEAFILVLALVGAVSAWLRPAAGPDRRLARFLAVYGLVLALIYSAIPYKTPWCLLSFLHPLVLVAGFGVNALWRLLKPVAGKAAFAIIVAAGIGHLGWLADLSSFRYCADPNNPYVYSQTVPDFLKLVRRVEQIAGVSPEGRDLFIQVVTDPYSAWPLPWYLRSFRKVGYWEAPEMALATPEPSIVITTAELEPAMAPRLNGRYEGEFFGLRPSVLLLLYTREDLWLKFLAQTRPG